MWRKKSFFLENCSPYLFLYWCCYDYFAFLIKFCESGGKKSITIVVAAKSFRRVTKLNWNNLKKNPNLIDFTRKWIHARVAICIHVRVCYITFKFHFHFMRLRFSTANLCCCCECVYIFGRLYKKFGRSIKNEQWSWRRIHDGTSLLFWATRTSPLPPSLSNFSNFSGK